MFSSLTPLGIILLIALDDIRIDNAPSLVQTQKYRSNCGGSFVAQLRLVSRYWCFELAD